MDNQKIRPERLEYKDISGSGKHIYADIPFSPNCAEFTLKKGFQPIVHGASDKRHMVIGYEPWIQFEPQDWTDMLEQTFKEMVDLWNEKYALNPDGRGNENIK